jgi:hypothetical protein
MSNSNRLSGDAVIQAFMSKIRFSIEGGFKTREGELQRATRLSAHGVVIATFICAALASVLLTAPLTPGLTQSSKKKSAPKDENVPLGRLSPNTRKLSNISAVTYITGGTYECSGAVATLDGAGVLFVDDGKTDQVFYMPVNKLGKQAGAVQAIPLGASIEDPEGITHFGSRYLIIGSHSTVESDTTAGAALFDFDPVAKTVSNLAVVRGLRKFLLDNVPELKPWANKTSVDGGLNIEGAAFDPNPQRPRVLFGLRGPLLNGNALLVAVRTRDRSAALTVENLELDEPNAIQLNLNGQGIRDIEYDSRLRAFLIISGSPENEKKKDFTLWIWSTDPIHAGRLATPREQALLSKQFTPEGITHLKIDNHEFIFVLGDRNCYAKIDYVAR